jgi:cytosine/adenosine deaminase-related metal-dependent hydrolase
MGSKPKKPKVAVQEDPQIAAQKAADLAATKANEETATRKRRKQDSSLLSSAGAQGTATVLGKGKLGA